jgi:hypothetical protein
MQRSERIALGAVVLVIAAFGLFIAAMRGEWRAEAAYHAKLDWAQANLGGGGYAAVVKGGDPDAGAEGGSEEAKPNASGEGDRLEALAEELAAQRAYPAESVSADQIFGAQRAFAQIKIRGNRGSKKGAFIWNSIGPSVARQPAVLNFTGQDYVTAGRTTAMVIDRTCTNGKCRLWIAAAGGGVWRTDKALHTNNLNWKFSSGGLQSNAFGALVQDPNDASGNTLYAGTGEPNASGDSESGVGLFKSTDGGESWSLVGTSDTILKARSTGGIAVDPTNPNVIYVATARGVRGISSVSGGAASTTGGPLPKLGVYKTTDGGATWSLVWDAEAAGSLRGVTDLEIDPLTSTTVYAAAFQKGIYRSKAGGAFQEVFAGQAPASNVDRTMFDLTVKGGKVRVYATNGNTGAPYAALFRTDDAGALVDGSPNAGLWTKLTSDNPADPGYGTYSFCTGQCWYDQDVVSPNGSPDMVYVIGSYSYGELGGPSNARGVVLSTDAGVSSTDQTMDAGFNSIHPDQHELVVNPNDPNQFFEASDGGIIRSSGQFADISPQCAARGLTGAFLTRCQQLLSKVPITLDSLNEGLTTLQFQSLSVNPKDPTGEVMGGTQDNGTWLYTGNSNRWVQSIYGDGGQSGFDVANPQIRFNTFFNQATDENFRGGDPTKWVVTSGPLYGSGEAAAFYVPIIADPKIGGTQFVGMQSVWRTKANGGNQVFLEANCPEFTTSAANPACGDWVRAGTGLLTTGATGPLTRGGGTMAAIERTASDTSTLWAATSTGRLYVSKNADADPAASVAYTRIDVQGTNALPNRFVSGIAIDPANPNRAWVSYSGYNTTIGSTTPGHVFEVFFNTASGTATWTDRSYDLLDLPITDVAFDDVTGDVYAASDFGVLRLAKGATSWTVAGDGLPIVETPGLTIVPGARRLYAATHGMGAWYMNLP